MRGITNIHLYRLPVTIELTKNATIKDNAKYDSKVRHWMKYLIKDILLRENNLDNNTR